MATTSERRVTKWEAWMLQYFCSSVTKPMSAVVLDGCFAHSCWNSVQRRARASSQGRNFSVDESHTKISSWCRRCGGGTARGKGVTSSLAAAALDTADMTRRKERGVTGIPCELVEHSSFEAKIASIRSRSDAEHRDCEIETRSAGSGVPTSRVSGGKLCWYWEQARWKEDTAMHERCFGWAFILARKVSMLETAVWNTSEGRSYQTLRHLNTCADPSLMPGEMPEVWGKAPPLLASSPASRQSSWPRRGCTSMTT